MNKSLPVIEIFGPTLQGEGAMIGKITHFIRFGGCDFRCSWCDSMHAVDPQKVRHNARWLLVEDILDEIKHFKGAEWVTITGGNPALLDLEELIVELHTSGFKVALETQGSIYKEWMKRCDLITISPKGPSSGMSDKFSLETFNSIIMETGVVNVKVVIFNEEDLAFASQISSIDTFVTGWYLSIGTRPNDTNEEILDRWRTIAESVMQRWGTLKKFAILPQAHVLLWGHKLGV